MAAAAPPDAAQVAATPSEAAAAAVPDSAPAAVAGDDPIVQCIIVRKVSAH